MGQCHHKGPSLTREMPHLTRPKLYLIPTLFALCEIPTACLDFSALELLYGRQVHDLLAVLRDLWGDKSLADENSTLYHYVL